MGAGAYGAAFLNAGKNVVLKYCLDYDSFLASINEAESLLILKDAHGVQKLVGMCPQRFLLATEYGGPILEDWLGEWSPLLPQQWIDVAIKIVKIFNGILKLGVVHNDFKSDNLCLQVTPLGIRVTLIDFGLARHRGEFLRLNGNFSAGGWYPPEFFQGAGGRCGSRSEAYSIGKVME